MIDPEALKAAARALEPFFSAADRAYGEPHKAAAAAITAYHAALPEVEVGELVERLKAEVVIDAGDGPAIPVGESARNAIGEPPDRPQAMAGLPSPGEKVVCFINGRRLVATAEEIIRSDQP